jgi:hypothetical protein
VDKAASIISPAGPFGQVPCLETSRIQETVVRPTLNPAAPGGSFGQQNPDFPIRGWGRAPTFSPIVGQPACKSTQSQIVKDPRNRRDAPASVRVPGHHCTDRAATFQNKITRVGWHAPSLSEGRGPPCSRRTTTRPMSSSGRLRTMSSKRTQNFIGGWHDPAVETGTQLGLASWGTEIAAALFRLQRTRKTRLLREKTRQPVGSLVLDAPLVGRLAPQAPNWAR